MDLRFARAGGAAVVGLRMWKYGLGNRLTRKESQMSRRDLAERSFGRASLTGTARTNSCDPFKAARERASKSCNRTDSPAVGGRFSGTCTTGTCSVGQDEFREAKITGITDFDPRACLTHIWRSGFLNLTPLIFTTSFPLPKKLIQVQYEVRHHCNSSIGALVVLGDYCRHDNRSTTGRL